MTKSNAERQAAYRLRHLKAKEGRGGRLNLVSDLHAKHALKRLSTCYAITQRTMLERILGEVE
ncbi:MAG: hypothetical protein ACREUR_00155 [Nitrosospira sp.]